MVLFVRELGAEKQAKICFNAAEMLSFKNTGNYDGSACNQLYYIFPH